MSCTRIDQEPTPQKRNSIKLSKMQPKLLKSSPIGPKVTDARALHFMARAIYVCDALLSCLEYQINDWAVVGANDAYEEALKLDSSNAQAKSGLASVKRAIDAEASADGFGGGPGGGLGNMFNDPQMFQKLANNPKTASLLADPSFMAKLQRLKQNPNNIGEEMRDPRFLQVMSVLLGIDMSFGGAGEGLGDMGGPKGPQEPEEDMPMSDAPPPSAAKPAAPPKAHEPEPEPEPEDEEAIAKGKAKEEADAEKKTGTELYKKREFDAAIEHYGKAWDIHKDITYLTNMSAAQFEKGDYEAAIETCKKAIAEGREVLADFKVIAKYVC